MAWELKKVEDQRKELVQLYFESDLSMSDICKKFGVSRKTGYKWIHRFNETGVEGLKDLSKAPFHPQRIYPKEVIDQLLDLKMKFSKWGPKKILARFKALNPGINCPSERRLYDIFKDHGLVTKRRIRKRVPATEPLKDVKAANDTWTADFKGWFLTKNGEKCEPFTVTDGQSRYVIRCIHLGKKTISNVWSILESAFLEYGLPNRFRTDNGPPFGCTGAGRITKLSVNLIKAGVVPEWIDPGHPEQNGRHERFHLTLKEAIAVPPAATLATQLRDMKEFVDVYNFDRPHEALDMKTPAECYCLSPRKWDGILRGPEYDSSEGMIRKVTPGGTVWVKGQEYYIGQALSGEYIQFKEGELSLQIHYGPILLGNFTKEKGLEVVKYKKKIQGKV